MTTPARPWIVQNPGPLTRRDDGLWTIDCVTPGLGVQRRMVIVKRADGDLLFFNAVPVPDATLEQLRALGRPAQVILPNPFHALDSAAFVEKLGVKAYAPEPALAVLQERVAVEPVSKLPPDAKVKLFAVEGFKTHEVVLVTGHTLVAADVITNVPHLPGLRGLAMRLVGFTGPQPKLPRPVQKRVGRDLKAVAAQLDALAQLEGLSRIIPTHGDIVESGAPEALRAIAASLR